MNNFKYSALEVANLVNGKIEGDPNSIAIKFSKIDSDDSEDSLTFLSNYRYLKFLYQTKASIVLVSNDLQLDANINSTIIRVEDPYLSFANIASKLKEEVIQTNIEENSYIHPNVKVPANIYIGAFAYISENVEIGNNCMVYPQVYIGKNVKIGDNCILYPGVKIYDNTRIGNNVIIHSGAIIGADGFGFAPFKEKFIKIEHVGNVIIEDNVEIGANTTIDKAQFDSTVIKKGVKIDNLVMVAHNVEIGSNTVIASQTGIAGSSKIGSNCTLAGQVGVSGHLKITNNVVIGPQTGVAKNIEKSGKYMGYPAMEFTSFARMYAMLKKLLKN